MSDKIKKKFKDTKIGGFLSGLAPDLLKMGLNLGSGLLPDGGMLAKFADKIKTSTEIDAEQKIQALSFLSLDVQDRQGARDMQTQIATSEHSTTLSKNFIYYFAMGFALFVMAIVVMLFLIEVPDDNKRVLDMLLGSFVTGLITIIAFFFGSSTGSKEKAKNWFK